MRMAIIGAGHVGAALATGLKGKGHQVTLGVRDPESAKARALCEKAEAACALPADAVRDAEMVILALPWAGAEGAVKSLGSLEGKIVIDCMNPLGMVNGALGLMIGHSTSGGEVVQGWLPGAHVVKTLNQTGAEVMAAARSFSPRPAMFMAGNDPGAKAQVAAVLTDLGFDALDAGDITKARILEPLAMVWINQALVRGKGRGWAFAVATAEAQSPVRSGF